MVLTVTERTFQREVLDSPELVLVNFGAPWCGLCHLINPIVQASTAQWGEGMKLVGVNADENFKLANTYRLQSLPTLLMFERGKVIQRLEGFHSRDDFRKSLEVMLRRSSYRLLESSDR